MAEAIVETAFFSSDYGKELLQRAGLVLRELAGTYPHATRLEDALRIVRANGTKFDEGAAFNVEWIASGIAAEVEALDKERSKDAIDDLYATFYRFISEYELTLPKDTELSFELRGFLEFARSSPQEFSNAAQRQIRFADHGMTISIMKRLLCSETLMNLRSIEQYSKAVEGRFTGWDKELAARSKAVDDLKDALKGYETAFNFVGLHKGFDDLAAEKRGELRGLQRAMLGLGIFTLIPIALELFFVFVNVDRFDDVKWVILASGVPALSLTVLLAYYFRLTVRAVDGAKSQLLQLELRKTLCRFIQSYADYTKKLKESGAESLAKFENVIFSGIVVSDDKIPATFDGVDQLAKLVKAMKSP